MLLISGRFGLVLVLFAAFLWYARNRFDALITLPFEAVQIVSLLGFYGLAAITAAILVRASRAAWQFLAGDDDAV